MHGRTPTFLVLVTIHVRQNAPEPHEFAEGERITIGSEAFKLFGWRIAQKAPGDAMLDAQIAQQQDHALILLVLVCMEIMAREIAVGEEWVGEVKVPVRVVGPRGQIRASEVGVFNADRAGIDFFAVPGYGLRWDHLRNIHRRAGSGEAVRRAVKNIVRTGPVVLVL